MSDVSYCYNPKFILVRLEKIKEYNSRLEVRLRKRLWDRINYHKTKDIKKEKKAAKAHRYYLKHKQQIAEYQKKYRETHREYINTRTRKWYNEHKALTLLPRCSRCEILVPKGSNLCDYCIDRL